MAKKAPRAAHKKAARPHAKKGSSPAERSSRARVLPPPAGFQYGPIASLLVPQERAAPVKASKMRQGIAAAKRQLDETLDELLRTMTGAYEIKEIKLVASFNADGKFLGFGVGGAATMEITICPCEET